MRKLFFILWIGLCISCLVELVCSFGMLYFKHYLECCTFSILALLFYTFAKDLRSAMDE